ncbi:MAG: hypothetical protein IPH90_10230 [Thermomonas sp.]|nr:hypothetical protein [Thermomonas sp.]
MHTTLKISLTTLALALVLPGCKPAATDTATPAEPAVETATPATTAAATPATWPASLNVMGDGFPNAGDPCRKLGESEATVNYLDDTATLAGCLSADDAAKLGGIVVATVEGVTLVSVPSGGGTPGDGDGQGDSKVAGTKYHATAMLECAGYKGAAAGSCEAGVVRDGEGGPYVEVTLPDGRMRTIFFNKDGSFLSFSTAQADGTAAMKVGSSREGDTTIATLGTERYEIPDALIQGG